MFFVIESSELVTFYLVFETINILIYSLLGVNTQNSSNLYASIVYFMVGFLGSIFFLMGLYFKLQILNIGWLGDWFLFFGLVLKLGAFPFSS